MIPLLRPSCSDLEIRYLTEVLRSGWWGLGPVTESFERAFAARVDARYAVGVNSGTAALDIALKAHGIAGGEVIVPALTFVSTGLAPLYSGNRVVFADIDEDSLCLDWSDAAAKITDRTLAIMPVWYAGTVREKPHGLTPLVIEDCAHAMGSVLSPFARTRCWSLHAVKNVGAGDGGVVTTDDEEIYRKLLPLRWCGIDRSTWDRSQHRYGWNYDIETVGYKCHMNDITAALALAQLERLDDLNGRRHRRVRQYLDALSGCSWLRLPEYGPHSSWHLFVVRVEAERRDGFVDHLLANGVSAGVHYRPLNQYPIFGDHQPLPVTDRVWRTLVTLPLYPDMTDQDLACVVSTVRSFR